MKKMLASLSVMMFSIFFITGSAHAAAAAAAGVARNPVHQWSDVPEALRSGLEAQGAALRCTAPFLASGARDLVLATYTMYAFLREHFSAQAAIHYLIHLEFIKELYPFMMRPPERGEVSEADAFMVLLISEGAALVNVPTTRRGCSGDEAVYPIQLAVELERVDYVAVLLDNGANPNVVDSAGASPLWHAVGRVLHGAVVRLLRAGACVDVRTTEGITPLMLAAAAGDEHMANILLAAGACGDLKDDKHGRTASGHACAHGHHDLATHLIGFMS